jgi:hypothetical protein
MTPTRDDGVFRHQALDKKHPGNNQCTEAPPKKFATYASQVRFQCFSAQVREGGDPVRAYTMKINALT